MALNWNVIAPSNDPLQNIRTLMLGGKYKIYDPTIYNKVLISNNVITERRKMQSD